MIDFRYHLISIVAVFLALGIGILMGSVVLDQRLVEILENELKGLERTNEALRTANGDLRDQVEVGENFALAARDLLLPGALDGHEVVLLTIDGTDAEVLDAVRAGIDEAGGEVAGSIVVTEKLALPRAPERDELALIVDSVTSTAEELRAQAGSVLGDRASAAAVGGSGAGAATNPPGTAPPAAPRDPVLADLSDAGFLEVDSGRDDVVVPEGAGFIVVAGSESRPPFPIADFMISLASALGRPDVPVVAAESASSVWGVTEIIRTNDDAQRRVSTVDQAESTSGTIGVILAYEQAVNGCTGRHYGVGDGVGGIIPRPPDDC